MSLYEHAHELNPPRLEYDPAMDAPEPPAMRRKPPFKTIKNGGGNTHQFESFSVYTGHCKGLAGFKYASFSIAKPTWQPLIMCERNDIARLLRFNRKAKSC